MFRIINIIVLVSMLVFYSQSPFLLAQEAEGDTTVETGDVEVNAELNNESNEGETSVEVVETEEGQSVSIENESDSVNENEVEVETESGENNVQNQDGDSSIDTGNNQVDLTETNQSNNNNSNVDLEKASSSEEIIPGPDDEATSTEDALMDDEEGADNASSSEELLIVDDVSESTASNTASTTITVDNDNSASTTNETSIDSGSGENLITGGDDAGIVTGDIGIVNILINFMNTNFYGDGKEYFINVFNKVAQSIDLSGFVSDPKDDVCFESECYLEVDNKNESNLDNSIVIDVSTGENLIKDTNGQASIETGDIDIVNDVLNIANLNVTGDDWFFAVVNIFGEMEGDVILPSTYGEEAEQRASSTARELLIANDNAGELINDIVVNANTGGNEVASSTGNSQIETGSVEVNNTIFNLINYNITGDSWKFSKVNVFGNWRGIIEGLPDSYSYKEDDQGITIYNAFLDDYRVDAAYAKMLVSNDNNATTTNNIEINATTGDNSILNSAGESSIISGDIKIQNSLLNFINSNFTGSNWEFSMVNVFGDWKGNLSFGQPDLWVLESVDKTDVGPNDRITYTYLFGNSGDAKATDVVINDLIDMSLLNLDGVDPELIQNSTINWSLGDLPPNTQGTVSYTVEVKGDIPVGETEIANSVLIFGNENERNYVNNEDTGLVFAQRNAKSSNASSAGTNSGGGGSSKHPNFSILKTNDADDVLGPGDIVNYTISIKNFGSDLAQDVLVLDVLKLQGSEEEINSELWDLETVYKGEEIVIEYSLVINDDIGSGTYINEVMIEGYDVGARRYINSVASSKIKVDNDRGGSSGGDEEEDIESLDNSEDVLVLGDSGEVILRANRIWPDREIFPGESFEYNLSVKNEGDIKAYNVRVNELLPDGFVFANTQAQNQLFIFGDLESGYETSKNIRVQVLEWAIPGEYSISGEVLSDNYKVIELENIMQVLANGSGGEEVEATEDEEVEVLAATGFSNIEFVTLLFGALGVAISGRIIRKEIE